MVDTMIDVAIAGYLAGISLSKLSEVDPWNPELLARGITSIGKTYYDLYDPPYYGIGIREAKWGNETNYRGAHINITDTPGVKGSGIVIDTTASTTNPRLIGYATEIFDKLFFDYFGMHTSGNWSTIFNTDDGASVIQCYGLTNNFASDYIGQVVSLGQIIAGITMNKVWDGSTWYVNDVRTEDFVLKDAEQQNNADEDPFLVVNNTVDYKWFVYANMTQQYLQGNKYGKSGSEVRGYACMKKSATNHWDIAKMAVLNDARVSSGHRWYATMAGGDTVTQGATNGMMWMSYWGSNSDLASADRYLAMLGVNTSITVPLNSLVTTAYENYITKLPATALITISATKYMKCCAGLPVIEVKNGNSYELTFKFSDSGIHYIFPSLNPMTDDSLSNWQLLDVSGLTYDSTNHVYKTNATTNTIKFTANSTGVFWLKWSKTADMGGGGKLIIADKIKEVIAS